MGCAVSCQPVKYCGDPCLIQDPLDVCPESTALQHTVVLAVNCFDGIQAFVTIQLFVVIFTAVNSGD